MRRRLVLGALLAAMLLFAGGGRVVAEEPAVPETLLTVAEASGIAQTAKSAEVDALIERLCALSDALASLTSGSTVEQRAMTCAVSTPEPANKNGKEAVTAKVRYCCWPDLVSCWWQVKKAKRFCSLQIRPATGKSFVFKRYKEKPGITQSWSATACTFAMRRKWHATN